MHYVKKRQRFENHNRTLSYDPLTKTSWSYGWYRISHKIEGILLMNTFPYSRTTGRHIRKIMNRLDSVCVNYIEVHAPQGIPTEDVELVISYMKSEIKRLQEKNNHKNSKGKVKHYRELNIEWMQQSIDKMSSIIIGKVIDEALTSDERVA